jgi:hypothetical protein
MDVVAQLAEVQPVDVVVATDCCYVDHKADIRGPSPSTEAFMEACAGLCGSNRGKARWAGAGGSMGEEGGGWACVSAAGHVGCVTWHGARQRWCQAEVVPGRGGARQRWCQAEVVPGRGSGSAACRCLQQDGKSDAQCM